MEILELSRDYVRKYYGGNFRAAAAAGDGLKFDEQTTRAAFNFGNGRPEDLKKHMRNNGEFCRYYDAEKKIFLDR